MYSIYRQLCGWGVELYCRPYSAGVLHSVSDQIQNLQIVSKPQTKVTSKDDIKGLVSLKFLRPCKWGTSGSEPAGVRYQRRIKNFQISINVGCTGSYLVLLFMYMTVTMDIGTVHVSDE
jgi:hypothetical protein